MDDCPNPFGSFASSVLDEFTWPSVVEARWLVVGLELFVVLVWDKEMDIAMPPNPALFDVFVGGVKQEMVAPAWTNSTTLSLVVTSYTAPVVDVRVRFAEKNAAVQSATDVLAAAFQIEDIQPA